MWINCFLTIAWVLLSSILYNQSWEPSRFYISDSSTLICTFWWEDFSFRAQRMILRLEQCECQGCCTSLAVPAAVTAQHSHTLSPWLLQVNSSWALTNMIHHLEKPHIGKTQAQSDWGWWGWNFPAAVTTWTGDRWPSRGGSSRKCQMFYPCPWESMLTYASMPKDVLCQ